MESEPITLAISKRICSHMNKDHQDAVISYARFYAGIKEGKNAELVKISSKAMELKVDEKLVEIPFDHSLQNSQDAHQTLVAMLKAIPLEASEA